MEGSCGVNLAFKLKRGEDGFGEFHGCGQTKTFAPKKRIENTS